MRPGVAAGHPATAEVGAEILAEAGTAADAVVAMVLASCVAESVYSGLLAGCHAVCFDGSRVVNLDGFAAVPSRRGELVELPIAFGSEPRRTRSGRPRALFRASRRRSASCGSARAGCRGSGSSTALGLARRGVPLPVMHERSLEMLGDLLPRTGRGSLRARGDASRGETLEQPGIVQTLEMLSEEGAATVYAARSRKRFFASRTSSSPPTTCDYRPRWADSVVVDFQGHASRRAEVSPAPGPRPVSRLSGLFRDGARPRARLRPRDLRTRRRAHDEHGRRTDTGRACVLTHSLGGACLAPRSGRAVEQPPRRVGHRARRSAAETTSRAAWRRVSRSTARASRSRSAPRAQQAADRFATVLAGVLDEGLDPETAVARPRVHPTPAVDAEPGVDERLPRPREPRAHGQALGARPPLLRRRQLRGPCRGGGRSTSEWRRRRPLRARLALLQQQLVDAPRRDRHPEETHSREVRDVDELECATVPVVRVRTSSIPWYSGRQRTTHSSTSDRRRSGRRSPRT